MTTLALICVVFLSACDNQQPATVIPDALLNPVNVRCASGSKERAVGNCLIALRQGLDEANSQIDSIARIVKSPQ